MSKFKLFVSVVLLAIVLSACGGGGGGGSSAKINVTMTDFHFTPTSFTIPAGKEITFTGKNNGAVAHDFIIMKAGTDVGDDYGPDDEPNVFWKVEIQPGQSDTETFTAPSEPGDYQVVCGIPGHYVAGMVANIKVVGQ